MILHVDMDAFFASAEVLDNPELAGRCVIVGGTSGRGVVSAASYEARKYGVHSAMPVSRARRICPGAVFLKPRRNRYREFSEKVMEVLDGFSPVVEQVSIDEAYVDISGCSSLHGGPFDTGRKIKERIHSEVGLTCSAGAAPLKFLSKIASDMDKPDGLIVIYPEEVPDVIAGLPVRKVPGVGARTMQQLERLGISVLGDAAGYDPEQLVKILGSFGRRLAEFSAGIDRSEVRPVRPVKSISSEKTLTEDTLDREKLRLCLLRQAEEVSRRLREKDLRAETVVLKVKYRDFSTVSRRKSLERPARSSEEIFRAAGELLEGYELKRKVRLIGLGASGLSEDSRPVQMKLFGGQEQEAAEIVI